MGHIDGPLRVIDVLSDSEVIVEFECNYSFEDTVSAWLAGIATKGLVDDRRMGSLSGFFWVPRTVSYATAMGGTRTVYYIEPAKVDPERIRDVNPPPGEYLKELAPSEAPPPQKSMPVGRSGPGRSWESLKERARCQ